TVAARNVIVGFFTTTGGAAAVDIHGAGTSSNVVEGDFIGTDSSGLKALPQRIGVLLYGGATSNTVGGTVAGARNVIAGSEFGVDIEGRAPPRTSSMRTSSAPTAPAPRSCRTPTASRSGRARPRTRSAASRRE